MDRTPDSPLPAAQTHWLILSHCFNMDGSAASQVIADKIPLLMARGIRPIVISAPMGQRATTHRHIQAYSIGPSALRFDARHLISERIGRGFWYRILTALVAIVLAPFIVVERLAFGLQNNASWALSAIVLGLHVIRHHKPTVIYSTGGAYSAHWAGYWLKRLTGVAWIAEVHDPMHQPDHVSTNRNTRRIAKTEALICQHANLAWWLTRGAFEGALLRHAELAGRGFWVHCGVSATANPSAPIQRPNSGRLQVGHFGSLSKSRNIGTFIEALAALINRRPEIAQQILVNLYGSDLDPVGRAAAAKAGIEHLFVFHGRLQHSAVFEAMAQVDLLLLIHGSADECSEYIPAKTYEYLWARRPILACTFDNRELDQLIEEANGYTAPWDNTALISNALEQAHQAWQKGSWKPSTKNPIDVETAVHTILDHVAHSIPQALPTPCPEHTA
jgi:glycosyltransferase involved in cell wall biosynthesis